MKLFCSLLSQKIQPVRILKNKKRPSDSSWESPKTFMDEATAQNYDKELEDGECSIGILCGSFSDVIAIDIDISYKNEGINIVSALHDALPSTPAIKLGNKGFTLFYKYNGEQSCTIKLDKDLHEKLHDTKAHIDILSDKRQSVIPPSVHPDTKKEYAWLTPEYVFTKHDLPIIDAASWEAFFMVLGQTVPAKLFSKGAKETKDTALAPKKKENGITHIYRQGAFQNDPTIRNIITHCLNHIPAQCAYEDWLKVGFAINHSVTKDEGAKLFFNWSRTAKDDLYTEDQVVQKCRDIFYSTSPIQEMQVTFQHLVYEAKKNPEFTVTQEQKNSLLIIQRAIQADRYDIGDIETAAKDLPNFIIPTNLIDAPIGSQAMHTVFIRQLLGPTIVHSEDGVLIFKPLTRQWENASVIKTPDISVTYNTVASYIKAHPEFYELFITKEGDFSEYRFNAAKEKMHSYPHISAVRKMLVENTDSLDHVENDVLDNDINTLGLPDGNKVNLRTGEVSLIQADDYITNRAAVNIAPEGQYGEAPEMLMEVFDDAELKDYMQMLCGYCISGDVSLKEVYFFIGKSGNNGKTFLLDILLSILGTSQLAARRNASTFMDKNKTTDRDADRRFDGLVRKRVVGVSDTAENHIFSTDLYKTLTDPRMTYRSLYKNNTTARNTAKFIICCNNLPRIGVMDQATKQRTVCIPFTQEFDPTDPKIQKRAKAILNGLPGLLRWMVDGRIKMLQAGNSLPKLYSIDRYTTSTVLEQDILGLAISYCCFNPLATTAYSNTDIRACLIQLIKSMDQFKYSTPNIDDLCNGRAIGRKLGALHFKQSGIISGQPGQRGWYMDLKMPEFKSQLDDLMLN